ncbi:MAG: DEAD/DEAH box helicase [Filifactoraceae bacterium]
MKDFNEYVLDNSIQKALLQLNYKELTPVQEKCIPQILKGENLIVKSPTGTGKTAAFAIPITHNILWEENKPQALIIVPSRELSIQIAHDFKLIGRYKRLKALSIFGKMPIKEQILALKQKNHIIISTPGRLMDLIKRSAIDLSKLKYLVIDEADELLKHDFLNQMNFILSKLPETLVTTLFTATLDQNTLELGKIITPNHKIIDVTKDVSLEIKQYTIKLKEEEKAPSLVKILKTSNLRAIVFTMTKIRADNINELLLNNHINSTCIHSNLEQKQRLKNLQSFRDKTTQVLVTTDLSSRGLDIDNLPLVINYDLPNNPQNYTHRIGRTGRNKNQGIAINFLSPKQEIYLKRIQEYTDTQFNIGELPLKCDFDSLETTSTISKIKGDKVGTDITKLFIQGGKKHKLRAFDIVGSLTSINNILGEDIGIIEIKENESYVEILNSKGLYALEHLREKNIKGRKRKVHIAKSK